MLTSKCVEPDKSILALWVDKAMRATLTKANIQLGFWSYRDLVTWYHSYRPSLPTGNTIRLWWGWRYYNRVTTWKGNWQTTEATSDATMVEGERDFYNGTTDNHLPNTVSSETCKENDIVSDSNTELAKIAQWGVKLHFWGGFQNLKISTTSILCFYSALHFDNSKFFLSLRSRTYSLAPVGHNGGKHAYTMF